MSRESNQQKIALAVGIALSAGVFSIIPSASAAPVVDHVVSGGAVIDQKTTPNVTDVTSTTRNNVIDWQDFSVSHGETVRFDGGAKTNNYLNVVSGVNTSHIDGAIKGGNNVYIVNPNGVVFGNSASVDVGSLYVSSRPLDTVNFEKTDAAGDMQPLADTAAMTGGDIVNMGTVQANTVFVEGGNIIISDAEHIKTADGAAVNNNVTIQTQGNITIGRSVSSLSAEQNANDNHNGIMLFANTADNNTSDNSGYTYTFNSTADYMPLIKTTDDLLSIPEFGMDKSYTLNNDLNFSGVTYTPIGTNSNPFKGSFDGQYHTVSGITVSSGDYGGLFGYTSGATIKAVGVKNVDITAGSAGGIAGEAINTTFEHVFVESGSIKTTNTKGPGRFQAGGIIGSGTNVTIEESYNSAEVKGHGAGIIGITKNGGKIENSYSNGTLGTASNGVYGAAASGSGIQLVNVYTTGTAYTTDSGSVNASGSFHSVNNDSSEYLTKSKYASWGNNISNIGGDGTVWRIYEGQSLPLLRAFLTAHGTVNVNYTYTHGTDEVNKDKGASNDLAVIYNGSNITLADVTFTKGGEAISTGSIIQPSEIPTELDGNVIGLDSSGNVLTKAIFHTGQQGYDLVGNNYTIEQRAVNVNTALGSANFVKEYDGEYKLTAADVEGLFANTGANTGIVDTDKDTVKLGFTGTLNSGTEGAPVAVYKDSEGNSNNAKGDAADVGIGKKVHIGGTLALTGNDKHNYKLVASTGDGVTVDDDTGAITIAKELTGTIYHKILKVGFNEQALNRQYDGTSVAKETVKASDFFLKDSNGNTVTNSEDVALVIDSTIGTAYFLDSNNGSGTGSYTTDAATYVGTHDVVFNGITLAGNKAKNYVLLDVNNPANVVYANTNTGYIHKVGDSYTNSGVPTNNGKWTTQGEITPRALSDYGFYWYDDVSDTTGSIASRQYNAGADFTYVDADNTNPIKGKIVNNNVTEGVVGLVTKDAGKVVFEVDSAEFITSDTDVNAGTAKDVAGTNGAQGVRYSVKVKGAANVSGTEIGNILQNYEFGGNVLNTTDTYSVAGAGEITPRTIKIGAAAAADKPYDADAIVKTAKGNENNEFTLSYTENDGYLDYTGGNQYKLLDDGTQIIYTGAYQDTNGEGAANVNFDGEVKDKNITYTATIKGGNGNYVFENSTAVDSDNNPQITISNGVGKITQREITSLYFKDVTKDYDTTATVNHDDIAVDVGSGDKKVKLYGSDSDNPENVFDMGKVTGVYVHKAEGKNDADVENGGAPKSKNVTYTLSDGFVKNHNYKLADSIGETVNGAGAITQATLDDRSKLALAVSGVTKVYDGDNDIKGAGYTDTDNKSKAFIGTEGLTYDLNGNKVTLSYDVYKAYYDSKDSKNGTAQGITYELSVSGDSTGNYKIGDALLTDGYLKWNKGVTGWTDAEKAKMTGTITKKDVTVTPLHDLVTKVYDGGTAVRDGNNELKNDTAVSFVGWIDGTKSVTANYSDKNVDNATETAAGGKQVNYVITLDDTSKGNYTLKDAAGNTLTDYILTGKGHITPATLTISFAPVSKIYDGTKNYDSTSKPSYAVTPTIEGKQTDAASGNLDDVGLNADAYNAMFKSADKGTWDVTYTIDLTGADKDNYKLAGYHLTTTEDGKTTIDGTGTIDPFALTDDDVKINFADTISKVYDATDAVAFDHTGDTRYSNAELGGVYIATAESYVNSITIGGVTLNFGTNGDYVINSANYNSSGIAANSATYKFQLQGSKLDNFDLTGLSGTLYDQTNKVLTGVKSSGVSITPKQLQASLNDTVLDLERIYDGTDSLPVSAAEAAAKVTVTGFVNDNGDTTAFDGSKVNGRYVDRNVAYVDLNVPYDERIVTTKDVLFDVKLTGNGAGNYVINDTNSNSATLTGSDMGKITPKALTVNFGYTEKTYNNKADAPVPADNDITLIGLPTVDNNLKLDRNTIVGQFGSKVGNEFKADGNVNYDETAEGKAGYKGVQYSNLRNAMETGFGTDNTGYKIAGNYTIADTVYFAEATQKGKIKRLALTMNDIEAGFKGDITKEYDGESAVSNPDNHFSVHTKAEITGEEIEFKLRHDDDWANYVDDTGNTQVNVVQGNELSYDNVVYKIKGLDADDILQNFDITGLTENSYAGTYTTKGSITPRVLKINVTTPADGYAKTYDGTDKVKDSSGNIINNFAYEYQTDKTSILEKDADTVNLVVTGAYDNANANKTLAGDTIQGQPDKKTIQYTVKLTSNDAGNYTLDAATHPAAGASTEVDSTTYTGQGDIKQRKVYVDFEDAINPDTGEKYGTKIDKQYNGGDPAADEAKKHRNHITFVGPEEDTGLVDTGLSLDTGNINANYVLAADSTTPDGNVARGDKGEVVPKYVHFTDFAFAEDNVLKNNYAIRAKDGKEWLTGSGTIKPIEVAVDITQAPVKDEYDGSTSVKAAYIANATNELNTDVADTGVSINGVAASFDNANAGSASQNYGGKGYSYTFNMDNPNYELVAKSGSAHTVKTTGKNTDGSLKVTLHGNDGTIKPRTITPTVNGVMTKEYDGTPYGTENAEANVSLSNVLNGDMNKLGLTVNAVYDNPEAGVSEDSNELKKHVVTYTLNLTNHNYKLAKSSIEGTGTISRKGLTVVAKPASINSGEVMPAFSGTVEGFVSKDTGMASKFTFASMPTVTNASAGTNPVYGWYNNRISGNFGLNYTFSQAPANATAFTVNYVDSGHNNPDTKVTPTNNIYQQISKDKGSGFGDNAAAALEYVNKNGQVIARETIDSGEIHDGSVSLGSADDMTSQDTSLANIGIVGGDIVNVDGADAAGLANIEVTDNGTTVNLEVTSLSETGAAADKQAVAEITDMPATADNSSAQIQNLDGRQEIVEQLENKDKDEEKKESEIAIESKSSQNDDEIELKIEGSGVKVA